MTEPGLPAGVSRAETLVLLEVQLGRIEGRLARQERLAGPDRSPRGAVIRQRLAEVAARVRALLAQLDGGVRHEREARQLLLLKAGITDSHASRPGSPLFLRRRKWLQEQGGLERDLEILARLAHQAAERFPDEDLRDEFAGCLTLARGTWAASPDRS